MTFSVKQSIVNKIRQVRNDDIDGMKESKFYMEMGDRIDDKEYYNALCYTIDLLEGKDLSMWRVEEDHA